jgi:eukaryotic-like serine/threonine-protein kinase
MYGGERGTELVDTLHELALTLLRKGNRAAAEPLFREAIDLSQRMPKRSAKVEVDALLNLARLVDRFDRKPAEAAVLYQDALRRARELYPPTHPDIGICLGELSRALREAGQLDEAESAATEAVSVLNATFGPRHRESIIATQRLAGIVGMKGRTADAERMFRATLDNGNSVLGVGHPIVLSVIGDYADFLETQGRYADALRIADSGLTAARRRFGEQDVYVARSLARRGRLYATMNDLRHAEEDFRRVLAIRERLHPPEHWRVAEAKVDLGGLLARARKYEEAEPLLLDASRSLEKATDAPESEKVGAIRALVVLYESSGRPEDADRYRALVPSTSTALRATNR